MGADYEFARRFERLFHPGNILQAGQTRYFTFGALLVAEIQARIRVPDNSVHLWGYAQVDVAPGAGEDIVFTVMQGGAPSADTLTIAGAVATTADGVFGVVFAPNNTISIRVVASGACADVMPSIGIRCRII